MSRLGYRITVTVAKREYPDQDVEQDESPCECEDTEKE